MLLYPAPGGWHILRDQFMGTVMYSLSLAALLAITACAPNRHAPEQAAAPHSTLRIPHSELPGKQPDGSVLLPNQWSLRPVGKQVELGDFPINVAVHPDGRFAAILHSGYGAHQIMVVDIVKV